MTQHQGKAVLVKLPAVVGYLLEVDRIGLIICLIDISTRINCGCISIERLSGLCILPLIVGHGAVQGQLQALDRGDISKTIEGEHIGKGLVGVEFIRLQEVSQRLQSRRTVCTAISTITIVIHLAILIGHDVAFAITQINRIDRCKAGSDIKNRLATIAHIVLVSMGKVDVRAHLQPVLSLVISLNTGSISLEIRVIYDTLVLQIAQGSIVGHLVATTGNTHVVFLAQRIAESLIHPVVRGKGIEFSVVINTITQGGIRVQAAVGSNEILSLRNGIDHIAQSALVACLAHGFVGSNMRIESRHALIAYIIIIESLVIGFIILGRVGDAVVVDGCTTVAAPLSLEADGSLLCLTLLGGNHDYTIGTTGTIEGVGCCILQHCDTLHIVRVEVIPSAIVRSTIHDNERRCSGVDGTEATDGKRRSGCWRTGSIGHLHTGYLALQSAEHIGELLFLQEVTFHYTCRTRER